MISALFAGRAGDVREPTTPPEQTRLSLKDFQGKEALFVFYGTASVPSGTEVSAGAEIGKIGSGQFPAVAPFIGLNFSFSLKENGKYQKISF